MTTEKLHSRLRFMGSKAHVWIDKAFGGLENIWLLLRYYLLCLCAFGGLCLFNMTQCRLLIHILFIIKHNGPSRDLGFLFIFQPFQISNWTLRLGRRLCTPLRHWMLYDSLILFKQCPRRLFGAIKPFLLLIKNMRRSYIGYRLIHLNIIALLQIHIRLYFNIAIRIQLLLRLWVLSCLSVEISLIVISCHTWPNITARKREVHWRLFRAFEGTLSDLTWKSILYWVWVRFRYICKVSAVSEEVVDLAFLHEMAQGCWCFVLVLVCSLLTIAVLEGPLSQVLRLLLLVIVLVLLNCIT